MITITVYSRSDLEQKVVGPGHNGCGEPHLRPRGSDGARVKVWALTCPMCETHLRTDSEWAATEADIPETPDEVKGREDFEKRGAADRDTIMAAALAKLAGVDLPPALRGLIGGSGPAVVTGTLVCEAGHDCDPGSKYCGECGSPVRQPVPALCPQGHEVSGTAKFCPECGSGLRPGSMASVRAEPVVADPPSVPSLPSLPSLVPPQATAKKRPLKDMRADELRAIARDKGLDDRGTRADLLERLRAA